MIYKNGILYFLGKYWTTEVLSVNEMLTQLSLPKSNTYAERSVILNFPRKNRHIQFQG
jgi:hypothetical protein